MSRRLRLLLRVSRLGLRPLLSAARDPVALRRLFDRLAPRLFRAPPLTCITGTRLAPGLDALRISNRPASLPPRPRHALLYFHGGAFIAGSPRTHAAMLARLARLARIEVIAPAYRLAPEHPFPAAPDDAVAAFEALVARGYRPEHILLGGDSAGGNLALGLLSHCLARGQRPAGLLAFSPVTDLTFSGRTITSNAARDAMLPAGRVTAIDAFYLAGADPNDPRASPLIADFPDPPPVFLQFAETEIVADDSRRLADRLRATGGAVTLDAWPDAPHVWVMFDRFVPEARAALARASAFIDAVLEAQASAEAPSDIR